MSILDQTEGLSLSDSAFARIAARINKMAGIVLEPRKKQMIFSRLSRRIRALGIADFETYLDFLDSAAGAKSIRISSMR